MAIEGNLDGLFVGADHQIIYADADVPPTDMTGWSVVLDIRKKDTSSDPPLLTKSGVLSGAYNVDPVTNAQIFTFTLSDDDLSALVFKGDDPILRYSFKRTNAGAETVLRFGDCPITRVTQV